VQKFLGIVHAIVADRIMDNFNRLGDYLVMIVIMIHHYSALLVHYFSYFFQNKNCCISTPLKYIDDLEHIKNEFKKYKKLNNNEYKFHPNIEPQSLSNTYEPYAPIVDLCLGAYIFFDSVCDNRTPKAWLMASTSFLLKYYSTSDLVQVMDIILDKQYVNLEFIEYDDDDLLDVPEAQSLPMRAILNNWKSLSESELLIKSQKVIFGLVTAGFVKQLDLDFSIGNYKLFADSNLTKTKSFNGMNDMLYSIFDLITTLTEVGYECFTDRSLQPLLVSDRQSRTWIARVTAMNSARAEDPVTPYIDHDKVIQEYRDLVYDGQVLLKGENRHLILPFFTKVSADMSRYIQKNNINAFRKAPFTVLLHGAPGQGKTTITHMIANLYHKFTTKGETPINPDLLWDPNQNMYTRNIDDEYWSGYKGAKHWCVIMDDIAREHPGHVSRGEAGSLKEIITACNTVQGATIQAAIEDKGVIPLCPKLIIGTTNVKDLNAHFGVACPAAVLRRLPHVIKVCIKPEYQDDNTGMLKPSCVMIEDAWYYEIEKVKLSIGRDNSVSVSYIPYKTDGKNQCTGEDLCIFLTEQMRIHELSSSNMMDSIYKIAQTQLCPHDVATNFHCSKCHPDVPPDLPPRPDIQAQSLAIVSYYTPPVATYFFTMMVSSCIYNYRRSFWDRFNRLWIYVFSGVFYLTLLCFPVNFYSYIINFFLQYRFLSYGNATSTVQAFLRRRIPREVNVRLLLIQCALAYCGGFVLMKTITGLIKMISSSTKKKVVSGDDTNEEFIQAQTNIWNNTKANDIFRIPRTSQSDNLKALISSINSSMFVLNVRDKDGRKSLARAFAIGDGRYVTIGHLFQYGAEWQCVARIGRTIGNCKNEVCFILQEDQLDRLPNDIVVFSTASIIPRKSLWNFLPDTIDNAGRPMRMISIDSNGEILERVGTTIEPIKIGYRNDDKIIRGTFMSGILVGKSSVKGDCGSLWICDSYKGFFISAMHCAGVPSNGRVYGCLLSKEIFKKCKPHIAIANSGTLDYFKRGNTKSGKMGPTPERSIPYWISEGRSLSLGSFPGRSSMKSKVKETIICSEVCKEFEHSNQYVAPLMSAKHDPISNTWINPFTIAATKQSTISCLFPDMLLLESAKEYVAPLIDIVRKEELDVSNLTEHESINGIPGDSYVNAIPMSTSGGFLFPGQKRLYFDGEPGNYYMNQLVSDKKKEIVDNYCLGNRASVLFNGALKDEPITQKKRDIGKTRVFTACDVAFSLLVREHYLRSSVILMTNNLLSECAVTMNTCSLDWKLIKDFICYYGDNRMVAGDYSSYDKGMPANAISVAFTVLDSIRESKDELSIVNRKIAIGIRTDVMFPVTNLNGDIFQFFGGNSSGHPLTVIINSIVNSLYMRIAYHDLNFPISTFRDNVHLMTYGDDNILGSKLDTYNHTSISSALHKRGVVYTMADKDSKSIPFLSVQNISFLKRKFVLSNEGDIIAPLDMDSIFRMLCMEVQGDNISSEERLSEAYLSARREMALHGKLKFDHFVGIMDDILSRYPEVTRFFIKQHKYDYAITYAWMWNRLDNKEDEITEKYNILMSDDLAF